MSRFAPQKLWYAYLSTPEFSHPKQNPLSGSGRSQSRNSESNSLIPSADIIQPFLSLSRHLENTHQDSADVKATQITAAK